MSSIEITALKQYAVLWSKTGHDAEGQPTVGNPVEIQVRWEMSDVELTRTEETPENIPIIVDVDRDISIGSRLWLGRLADLPVSYDQYRVISFDKTPDIKGRKFKREVSIVRI